ncbi:glycosyltransferase family 2 protein [uncultured Parabacteroides sp.]|uniref:glycosyltransferase family 2 protein n=2 Tax=uncultured Parabacteroides sp. TaxID=512312 RepID=UPI0025ED2986|nr:glycosyltransferase family 2 protein [uncultured Parabacteroides sp.]
MERSGINGTQRCKISVIVPVYKAEETLSKCISSILEQSFPDFELLLIDDGSPDDSGLICEEWSGKDKRIRVFHQQNTGVSAARNKGLVEATGLYVCFVDSDDWIKTDYLKELYDALLPDNSKSGLIIHGFAECSPDGRVISETKLQDKILYEKQFAEAFIQDDICRLGYICSKLYRKDLIDKHDITFNTEVACCEDLLFMLEYLLYCDYIVYGKSIHYIYIKYDTSLSIRVNPFESEYICLLQYMSLAEQIKHKYDLSSGEMEKVYHSLMICFRRALKTDYQPGNPVFRKKRLMHLKKLVDTHLEIIHLYYRPVYKIDQFGKYLLLHRMFYLYDLLITTVFALGIRSVFLGPKKVAL